MLDRIENRADLALVLRNDALQHRALRARSTRDQHLLIDGRRSGDHVRLLVELREQRLPVANAVALDAQQVDVRGRAQQPVLQVLAEAVVDGQRDDERGHACSYSDDGDDGDDADDGLAPFGSQITRCYEELKLHPEKLGESSL